MSRYVIIILFCTFIGLLVGCQTAPVEVSEPEVVTPSQQLTQIEETIGKAEVTHQSLKSDYKSFRVEILEKLVDQALADIKALTTDENATDEQIEQANVLKSNALYYATLHGTSGYAQRLSDWAQTLVKDDPKSEGCRVAVGRWLQYFYGTQESNHQDALKACTEYMQAYPDAALTSEVVSALSDRWVDERNYNAAKKLLTVAYKQINEKSGLQKAQQKYTKHVRANKKRIAKQRADNAFRRTVLRELGEQKTGFFVMYSEEKSNRAYKRCDYSTVAGLEGAVNYAQGALNKDWKWEVVAKYPPSPQGEKDAANKRSRLIRANTTFSFSN